MNFYPLDISLLIMRNFSRAYWNKGRDILKIIIIATTLLVPILMLYLQHNSDKTRHFFTAMAVISSIVFGSIAATSIYQIIVDDAVFMTTIHAVFLNPLFLVAGAYMGVFLIYQLMYFTFYDT